MEHGPRRARGLSCHPRIPARKRWRFCGCPLARTGTVSAKRSRVNQTRMRTLITTVGLVLALALPPPHTASAAVQGSPQAALDQLLAPIALYPDQLLAQILMSASSPARVSVLHEWMLANPTLKGTAAQDAAVKAGFDASFVGRIPFGQNWAVLAKAGVFMYETESKLEGDSQCCGAGAFRNSDSGSDLLYGLGVERAFGRWKLGLGYQLTKVNDGFFADVDLKSLSLSAAYTWGLAPSP